MVGGGVPSHEGKRKIPVLTFARILQVYTVYLPKILEANTSAVFKTFAGMLQVYTAYLL